MQDGTIRMVQPNQIYLHVYLPHAVNGLGNGHVRMDRVALSIELRSMNTSLNE